MKTCVSLLIILTISCTLDASTRTWTPYYIPEAYGVLTMSRNQTWPVVSTSKGTYFLNSGGFTQSISHAAAKQIVSGPNGQIAVLTNHDIKLFQNNRWSTLLKPSTLSTSIAFDQNGNLFAAAANPGALIYYAAFTGTTWAYQNTQVGLPSGSYISKLAIDQSNSPVIATPLFLTSPIGPGMWDSVARLNPTLYFKDLAFSSAGLPGLACVTPNSVAYASYNPQTQEWYSDIIASSTSISAVAVAFDNNDNPSLAYCINGQTFFATNDGTGSGWQSFPIDSFAATRSSLAFDAQNNPIACFSNDTTTLVQYDPVVAPEPSSMALLVAACALYLKKRHPA